MSYRDYQSLIQPVAERARLDPDRLTLIFIPEDGEPQRVTAAAFYDSSAAFAHALSGIGVGPDDLVILVLNHSRALLSAFWGAMLVGAVPSIFPFLTEKLDPQLYMQRVRALVEHEGVKAVITFPDFKESLSALLSGLACRVLSIDEVSAVDVAFDFHSELGTQNSELSSDRIAFLQHSSGTTGLQKGVALSHRSVLNQIDSYSRAINLNDNDVVVSWLPLYHDMGLIAGFVMPITAGAPLVLMSPFHWVRSPKILFQAIHDYRGTLCWLPNFAYNHCANAIRQRDLESLDLSSWRMAINCSEPVRHHSHRLFAEKFAPYGFQESALAVSYAMAEATFAVTQTPLGAPPRIDWISMAAYQADHVAVLAQPDSPGAMPVVSCGPPIGGAEVAIVDSAGLRLPERRHGEVIIRSDSMLSGYYKRPDLDAEARLDGWHRTGDMGYMADGELYISGRQKDLIITGGKNVYPQDLEAIASAAPGIYAGRAVAFGVEDERLGTESIVMVCELARDASPDQQKAILAELRRRIVQQTEVTLADARLVAKRWVIKTSSGKIARADNRAKYLREFRAQP